jgi:hypothetical protein
MFNVPKSVVARLDDGFLPSHRALDDLWLHHFDLLDLVLPPQGPKVWKPPGTGKAQKTPGNGLENRHMGLKL